MNRIFSVSGDAQTQLSSVKVANPADVAVELLPGPALTVGSRVSFHITSKKAGYVVLIDIDATGKLTQIYPNTLSLTRATRPNGNYIKAGGTLVVPSPADPYAGVEYVVSPPSGQAMVVAILSEQPVQLLDLPDIPPEVKTQADALSLLTRWASELRIPDNSTGQLREAKWSFDAKAYAVQ